MTETMPEINTGLFIAGARQDAADSFAVHDPADPQTVVGFAGAASEEQARAAVAAAVVFAHQHPSGISEPSSADRVLTQQLQAALALIDVRVLDHIIVGQGSPFSFAESGLL